MSLRAVRRAIPSNSLRSARLLCAPALRMGQTPLLTTTTTKNNTYNLLHQFPQFQLNSSRFQHTDAQEEVRKPLSKEVPPRVYTYEDIKQLVTNPDTEKIIVDVREPVEYQEGAIPGAVNIPYKSTPGALDLSPEEFEEIFKFPKPSKDTELIFYCLAGVRSTAAADLAQIFGYNKLGNYIGSWEDWVLHESGEVKAEE